MKIVAKCSAFVSLSYQVHGKLCNPIPLIHHIHSYFLRYRYNILSKMYDNMTIPFFT